MRKVSSIKACGAGTGKELDGERAICYGLWEWAGAAVSARRRGVGVFLVRHRGRQERREFCNPAKWEVIE